ncbi:MAG: hypothetical protein JWQ98_2832 [Chlorobi bacterium]|jgi:hypothetical protein|nr:hypothetical protein [Chlorobiota bacterium]
MRPLRPSPTTSRPLFLGLILSAVLAGCSPTATSPGVTVEPTYTSIRNKIFTKSCSTPSCHSTEGFRGAMVLEADKAYDNLVSVPADNDGAKARHLLRVSPGQPDSSFLYIKLTHPAANEGSLMPYSGIPLDSQSISAIRTWIANGAKRD